MAYHNLLSIRNVYFGANAKKTNIDSLLEFLGSKHVKCLLTLHCLTGCNTVGKFHNVSKESWTKLFLQTKDQDIFKTFESLQQEVMPKTIHYLAKFIFWGYINRPKHQNLTTLAEVWVHLYKEKKMLVMRGYHQSWAHFMTIFYASFINQGNGQPLVKLWLISKIHWNMDGKKTMAIIFQQ